MGPAWAIAAAWAQQAPPGPGGPPDSVPAPSVPAPALPTLLPSMPTALPPGSEPPPVAPPPPPAPPPAAALADPRIGHRWVGLGPTGVDDLSSIAVHPAVPTTWAIAALDGAVWVSTDAGRQWTSVLGPFLLSSHDEEILRELDARVGELQGELDPTAMFSGVGDEDEIADQLQQFADDAQAASAQAIEELQAELDAGSWFLEQQALRRGEFDHARPRVWFTRTGRLLVGRADGLRLANPGSGGWDLQVLSTESVSAALELPDGSVLVGSPAGLERRSPDLQSAAELPAFSGERVLDLVFDGGLFVATAAGVRWTGEGVFWQTLPVGGLAYTARPTAQDALGLGVPLLVAQEDTVRRAARPLSEAPTPAVGGPMPRTLAIARRADDLLLAASATGPWISADGGRSWSDLALGEVGVSDVRDVALAGPLALVATAGGLYRLEPVPPPEPRGLELPTWVPVGALVDAAIGRPELGAHVGSRWVAALLPTLTAEFTWNQHVFDDWDADTWTLRGVDAWWQIRGVATWYPGRQRTSTSYDVLDPQANLSVLVLDDDVIVDDGSSTQVLGSAVRRGATEYRSELTEQIGRLWTERQRLVAEGVRPGAPVAEQVRAALRVAELEARLDALTDGAVSDWGGGP